MDKKLLTIRIEDTKRNSFIEKAKREGKTATSLIQNWIDKYLADDIDSASSSLDNLDNLDNRVDERIDTKLDEKLDSLDNRIDEQIDKTTQQVEHDLRRLVSEEMARLHKDWNNRLENLEQQQQPAKKTIAPLR